MSQDEVRFSAADLEPTDSDRRAARMQVADRAAATAAVLAAGAWAGGMVALGACAAPFVFRMTPTPFSGDAMGAAFARFDQIALGSAVVILGAELVRTWVARRRARRVLPRLRIAAAVLMACSAAYIGLVLTPAINDMHRAGTRRGVGPDGAELERVHARAEAVGKAEVLLGAVLVALHIFTLGPRRPDDDDEGQDDDAPSPLPPGPRGAV